MNTFIEKYVNPLTDFGFKKLFGSEPNKELLIDFLNQILPERHRIQDLQYAKNKHLGAVESERRAIFDLYCRGESGERFILEIQKAKQNYFKDRSVYYSSFPIQEQAKKREWNYRQEPEYTVGILDFVFDDHKDEEEFLHVIELKNQRCDVFYDKLKFIYIELPKFKKTQAELETHFDKWLYVLRHLSELQDRPRELQERIFKKLFQAAEIAKFSQLEREAYEESVKYYRDIHNVVESSKAKGMEEGFQKGLDQKSVEIARHMKLSNEPLDKIMRYTGLSAEEIDGIESDR